MIGQVISHYKILEKLGEGGMGVVYKAEDIKLHRLVALKVFPRQALITEEDKTRFAREAQAAASLSHPNIAMIHEFDEVEGQAFIAMEYIDGETLKKKIQERPLPINEAVNIAIAVAEGLGKAHEKGITHRDIKSDNVMISRNAAVKIMDFGLAEIAGRTRVTKEGMTVGTVAYMSPQQALGEKLDQRTDIWSLGVVLYEMITGRLPFPGDYEQAVVYRILNEEPEPITSLRSNVPMELERIVKKCMEKETANRYQHVDDLIVDLRRVKDESSQVSRAMPVGMKAPATRQGVQVSRVSKKKILAGVMVITIVTILAFVFLFPPKKTERPPVHLNPSMTFRVLQIPFSQTSYSGLSPDGNWVAFGSPDEKGNWDVYLMSSSGGEPRRVTFDSRSFPIGTDISPDGSQIIYGGLNPKTQKTELFIVPSLGGPSKKILEVGSVARWRPDGERIGYIYRRKDNHGRSGRLEFWSIKPDGGDNRLEFIDSTSTVRGRISVSWSADGKSVAWIRTFPEGHQEVIVHELESGKERQLTFDKKNIDEVFWTSHDEIVFSSTKTGSSNLWVIPASGGQAVQLTKGSGPDIAMKVSADGKKLLYLQQQLVGHIWIASVSGSNARQITFDDRPLQQPSLSPDGKHVAFVMGDPDPLKPSRHVYVMDRNGSNRRQLSSGNENTSCPLWSPDGKWIAYGSRAVSEPLDSSKVYILDASTLGAPRLSGEGEPLRWIDSNSFISWTPTKSWLNSIDGTSLKQFYQDSTLATPVVGGKYILFLDNHKSRDGIWIVAAQDTKGARFGKPKRILSSGHSGAISPNGKFLFYIKSSREMWRISLPNGKEEKLRGVFPGLDGNSDCNVSYGDKEIIYTEQRTVGKLVMIDNLH